MILTSVLNLRIKVICPDSWLGSESTPFPDHILRIFQPTSFRAFCHERELLHYLQVVFRDGCEVTYIQTVLL